MSVASSELLKQDTFQLNLTAAKIMFGLKHIDSLSFEGVGRTVLYAMRSLLSWDNFVQEDAK